MRIHDKPRLDVRDLEIVLEVAAAGTTARAAAALHVTQSAVSRALLLAEDKLGTRLFERTARGLVPTPAGRALIDGAPPLLQQLAALEARAEEEAAAARGGEAGAAAAAKRAPLRVVCECYTAYRWLPSTLARLDPRALDVKLAVDHTAAPVSALLDDAIDVALLTTAPLPARAAGRLDERALFSDEIVFVMAASHPLAAKDALARRDLERHPLIVSTQTPDPERRWFLTRIGGSKRLPRPLTFPLTEAIVDAARAALGVAVMSEWIAEPYLSHGAGDLVVRRFQGRPLLRRWRVAYRRDRADDALSLAEAIAVAPPRIEGRTGTRSGSATATPRRRTR